VEPEEIRALLWSFSYFFSLLCSYYIVRPMRDEMGIAGGVEHLQWLFTGTFLAMLAAVPLFGWVTSRYPCSSSAAGVLFFIANLLSSTGCSDPGFTDTGGARLFYLDQRLQSVHRLGVLEFHGRPVQRCPGQASVRLHCGRRHRRSTGRPRPDRYPGHPPRSDQPAADLRRLPGVGDAVHPSAVVWRGAQVKQSLPRMSETGPPATAGSGGGALEVCGSLYLARPLGSACILL
jgi:hypothetical protein